MSEQAPTVDWIEVQFDDAGPGSDHEARLIEWCPFVTMLTSICRLNSEIECRYGLTEVKVPRDCPIRADVVLKIHKTERPSDE